MEHLSNYACRLARRIVLGRMAKSTVAYSWRRVPPSWLDAVRDSVPDETPSKARPSFVHIAPTIGELLETKKTKIYIARPYERNWQKYAFAAYKEPCAARSWLGKIDHSIGAKIYEESRQVELETIEDQDLFEFLEDPRNYYITGARLDWLRDQASRIVGEAEANARLSEDQFHGFILAVSELFGGLNPLSRVLRGESGDRNYLSYSLDRGFAKVRRVSHEITDALGADLDSLDID